jgi:hypothetical protein
MDIIGIILLAFVYLVPSFVAAGRNHHNSTPIFLVNLFFGWTVLGWLIALVWSFTEVHKHDDG